jgi:RNA polymerase sigma-70 factor (ECF subfamily)
MGETTEANELLDRHRAGDPGARDHLIALAQRRFVSLARLMLRRYQHVKRWEQTDDLLQDALLRLDRALANVQPVSLKHLDNLAAAQIRRGLIDLARHYHGPEGLAKHHHTDRANPEGRLAQLPSADAPPETLEEWTAFHEAVETLPENEKTVVDLIWYRGLTHEEAAELLGTSTKTIQRRWASARLTLSDALHSGDFSKA